MSRVRVIRPGVDRIIPVLPEVQAAYEAECATKGRRGRKPKAPEPTYLRIPELEAVVYAPGDGDLSFTLLTLTQPRTATGGSPTRAECEQLLPEGWELYENGPYFRARKTDGSEV